MNLLFLNSVLFLLSLVSLGAESRDTGLLDAWELWPKDGHKGPEGETANAVQQTVEKPNIRLEDLSPEDLMTKLLSLNEQLAFASGSHRSQIINDMQKIHAILATIMPQHESETPTSTPSPPDWSTEGIPHSDENENIDEAVELSVNQLFERYYYLRRLFSGSEGVERKRIQNEMNEIRYTLMSMGYEIDQLEGSGAMIPSENNESLQHYINKLNELREQLKRAEEHERQRILNDISKLEDYLKSIGVVFPPKPEATGDPPSENEEKSLEYYINKLKELREQLEGVEGPERERILDEISKLENYLRSIGVDIPTKPEEQEESTQKNDEKSLEYYINKLNDLRQQLEGVEGPERERILDEINKLENYLRSIGVQFPPEPETIGDPPSDNEQQPLEYYINKLNELRQQLEEIEGPERQRIQNEISELEYYLRSIGVQIPTAPGHDETAPPEENGTAPTEEDGTAPTEEDGTAPPEKDGTLTPETDEVMPLPPSPPEEEEPSPPEEEPSPPEEEPSPPEEEPSPPAEEPSPSTELSQTGRTGPGCNCCENVQVTQQKLRAKLKQLRILFRTAGRVQRRILRNQIREVKRALRRNNSLWRRFLREGQRGWSRFDEWQSSHNGCCPCGRRCGRDREPARQRIHSRLNYLKRLMPNSGIVQRPSIRNELSRNLKRITWTRFGR